LYKAAIIIFLVCFSLYILFTREPDYFETEFTPGKIVLTDSTDFTKKAVEYRVGKETFKVPITGWGASQVSKGQSVKVIYNASTPSEGAMYSLFSYWIKLPELLISIIVFIGLFAGAVFITGENQPDDPPSKEFKQKRKYKD
jgi:hypothetical protein